MTLFCLYVVLTKWY